MTGINFDLKEDIRSYWPSRAENFDDSPSHTIDDKFGMPCWHALLRQAMNLTAQQDMKGINVLDIACGTGEVSRMACSLGATVTGLDFSEDMHAIAKEKLADQNWTPCACDAENLAPIADNTFDFIITRHLAWTLVNPFQAYAEWLRVLKPEGRLLINDGDWSAPFSRTYRIKRWIANLMSQEGLRKNTEHAQDMSIRRRLHYSKGMSAAQLLTDVTSQGFEYVNMLDISPLYIQGMRGLPLAARFRMSPENRFAIVFKKPTLNAVTPL